MPLYICLNSESHDSKCEASGSSAEANVPVWWGMLMRGEAVLKGVFGKALCLPLNFVVKLKLLFKKKNYL